MADRTDDRARARRATRIAPLAGLAGRTSGETVAVALARKRARAGETEQYVQQLSTSTGMAVKAGQLLWDAVVGAELPSTALVSFRQALTGSTDDAPIMSPALTSLVVRAELGGPPDEVFAEFDPIPFAVGPICQVHAATLHDGRQVAVKVRYWGAAQAVRTALAGEEVRAALGPLAEAGAGITPARLHAAAGELRGRVEERIGLRAEAAEQAGFAAAYQGHRHIRIPYVVPELTTQRIFTMQRVSGLGLAEARQADAATRNLWGEVVYRFRSDSMRRLGRFSTDPGSSGNQLFHQDGGVTFLGFTRVRRVVPDEVAVVEGPGSTFAARDGEGLTALHRELCVLSAHTPPEQLAAWHREMFRPLTSPQPFTCTPGWAEAVAEAGLPANWPCDGGPECRFAVDIDTGTAFLLGALHASANWSAIRSEPTCGSPAAAGTGSLESASEAPRTGEIDVH